MGDMRTSYQPSIEIRTFATALGYAPAYHLTLADVAALPEEERRAYEDEMAAAGMSLSVGLDGSVRVVGLRGPMFRAVA